MASPSRQRLRPIGVSDADLGKTRSIAIVAILAAIAVAVARAQGPKENTMTLHAKGTFDVKLALAPAGEPEGMERRTLEKRYHGELDAESRGEMLSAGDPTKGSAGLVAMEVVTGTLRGKRGTFALQHGATMRPGARRLHVKVVPGSGTGALQGLSGEMTVDIDTTPHAYDLAYTLPEAK